jgi:hypothetical protein
VTENPKHAIKKERTGDGDYLVEIRSKDGALLLLTVSLQKWNPERKLKNEGKRRLVT